MFLKFEINGVQYNYRKNDIGKDGVYYLDTENKTFVFLENIPAEVQTEITRLQAEYDSKQYARDRAKAYPSLTEQADMAYWDRQNGTTTLDDAISAIKIQFPKG